ncbi:hypothetical protein SEMRO_1190_G250840.1 [Seminavis robusta]|uniref:Uncharacterized protein n=1 Tax=Seminavis robusta TaxID=568900 RepID=A0A9N8EM09_9STRA|nr:hypothetical protein SEMRO_1190_G250840.1 [Seminavis robusta]|eukprot:Sro1190_g250840.1 n/a (155) ;mRNA; f:29205-29669
MKDAITETIRRGTKDHTRMDATFCSNVFFDDETFLDMLAHVKKNAGVKQIVEASHDLITCVTVQGKVVTIRFYGAKKFCSPKVPEAPKVEAPKVSAAAPKVDGNESSKPPRRNRGRSGKKAPPPPPQDDDDSFEFEPELSQAMTPIKGLAFNRK